MPVHKCGWEQRANQWKVSENKICIILCYSLSYPVRIAEILTTSSDKREYHVIKSTNLPHIMSCSFNWFSSKWLLKITTFQAMTFFGISDCLPKHTQNKYSIEWNFNIYDFRQRHTQCFIQHNYFPSAYIICNRSILHIQYTRWT